MDGQRENCYLWVDQNAPEDERCMSVMCQKCHDEGQQPQSAWFWEGSRLGYGPFDFICDLCGHVIHSAPKSGSTNDIEQRPETNDKTNQTDF